MYAASYTRPAMRLRSSHQLVLTLVLLLGQWLSLAHAFEHPALAPEPDCQVCVHVHVLGSGAVSESASCDVPVHAVVAPQRALWIDRDALPRSLHPIRGPPRFKG